jgi:hypothetical protein
MKLAKICTVILAIAVSVAPAFALAGQVVTVSGKVEMQTGSGAWKPLKAGDSLEAGSMISTGFKSEATIKLGASILTVRPLTRMTLNQLVEKEDTVETDVFLEVGNVKAEVNSLNGKKNGFSVKSPVATASVRGTVLEVGDFLVVYEGKVQYKSATGQTRYGTAGEQLNTVSGAVTSPVNQLSNEMHVIALSNTPMSENLSPILATAPSLAPVAPDVGASTIPPAIETITSFDIN